MAGQFLKHFMASAPADRATNKAFEVTREAPVEAEAHRCGVGSGARSFLQPRGGACMQSPLSE
jgi:hypothetical protein